MKTLDDILKKAGRIVLPLSFLALPLFAQNQVTGHVEEVPSKTNAFARITLTNTGNNEQYTTLTDINTGNFYINVPSGNYDRKVEVQNNFLYEDALDINLAQYMDLQTIEDIGKETTFYSNILEVVKVLTRTRDGLSMDTRMERWHDEDQPIKVYARNNDLADPQSMPIGYREFFDSAVSDIQTKSDSKVTFSEQSSPVDIGINFEYIHNWEMPLPGSVGYTLIEEYYPDDSPKKVKIYIDRDNLTPYAKNYIFRKELMRTMITTDDAMDPNYLMARQPLTQFLSDDEGKSLDIMYTLKNGTDMKNHKYTVIQNPVPVELTSFTASAKDNIVKLLWNTATEVNNYGFDIERKSEEWKKIGFVQGNGNSNSPKNYEFLDTLDMPGIYTYRLKQQDNDGTLEYSQEVKVDLTDIIKNYELMQNYPNPFNPETNIKFKIPQKSHIKLTIYDMLGTEIEIIADKMLEPGTYTEKFNGKDKASGIYIYKLEAIPENSKPYIKTQKMMLVK